MLALLCAAGGGLCAFSVGVWAEPIGRRLAMLDYPDGPGGRKLHAGVTPLVGGLAITLSAVGAILAIVWLGGNGPGVDRDLAGLGWTVAAMFLIGAADDRFELSVRARLIIATLVLAQVVVLVPDFQLEFLRIGTAPALHLLNWLALPLTLLCLVGLLNAVNMADGKNGIVIGLALIWSAFLIVHLPQPEVPVTAAVGAALAVLFVFNLRGRLFLGDGGSYAVSALFGLLAIDAYNHDFPTVGAEEVALLFAIPVFDTLRLVVARVVAGRSPFSGGRDHLHHYLYGRVGWPRGLYVYLALVGLPTAGAALVPETGVAWLLLSAVAYTLVLVWAKRTTV